MKAIKQTSINEKPITARKERELVMRMIRKQIRDIDKLVKDYKDYMKC